MASLLRLGNSDLADAGAVFAAAPQSVVFDSKKAPTHAAALAEFECCTRGLHQQVSATVRAEMVLCIVLFCRGRDLEPMFDGHGRRALTTCRTVNRGALLYLTDGD